MTKQKDIMMCANPDLDSKVFVVEDNGQTIIWPRIIGNKDFDNLKKSPYKMTVADGEVLLERE